MLREARISGDVLRSCLVHALTTEREEVMGLLIGEVSSDLVCSVLSLLVVRRSDKRQDRVEISDQQLVEAAQYCERLSQQLNQSLRVVGWYHSHPHITVWPSHVDLRTQLAYQQMDANFVGVIFSVFNQDHHKSTQSVKVVCFQSERLPDGGVARVEVAHRVAAPEPRLLPSCLAAQLQISEALVAEEREVLRKAMSRCRSDDVLSQTHNACSYHNAVCRILETLLWPMLQDAELEVQQLREEEEALRRQKEELLSRRSRVKSEL